MMFWGCFLHPQNLDCVLQTTRQGGITLDKLKSIGVLAHPLRPQTAPVAERIAATLIDCGAESWLHMVWTPKSIEEHLQSVDMIIAIGGDGAMLRAARTAAPFDVPVLGLNMGRLGFLTEIADPDDWESIYLPRVLSGDYWIEKRMMLTASHIRDNRVLMSADALNDVVISGDAVGRIVQLETYIDGHWTTTYNSDALIVSTPTGSSAYALAAGGPILPPDLLNILLVPAAPHLSMDRPIILSEGAQVTVKLSDESARHAVISVDGAIIATLEPDDHVRVQSSDSCALFVRMRGRNYFYRSLLDRLEPRITGRPKNPLFNGSE